MMTRIFAAFLLVLTSCVDTYFETDVDINVEDLNVGSICEFSDQLISGAQDHFEGVCDGYAVYLDDDGNEVGCVETCKDDDWCMPDYYCDLDSACTPKVTDGECTGSEQCLVGLCLCDVCIDPVLLIELSLGG